MLWTILSVFLGLVFFMAGILFLVWGCQSWPH